MGGAVCVVARVLRGGALAVLKAGTVCMCVRCGWMCVVAWLPVRVVWCLVCVWCEVLHQFSGWLLTCLIDSVAVRFCGSHTRCCRFSSGHPVPLTRRRIFVPHCVHGE